jgi:mono/diheme cytochrome c family protein
MIRPIATWTTILLCLLISGASPAQIAPADAQKGHQLAERLCAICHSVTPGSTSGRPDVPSFAVIAKLPNLTPERLVGAIILPHPPMPGVALTTEEIRDVVAYIMSLRPLQ